MNYEQKLKRIGEISDILEKDDTMFEESVKLYEEACKLIKDCFDVLSVSGGKIKEITENLSLIDFDTQK